MFDNIFKKNCQRENPTYHSFSRVLRIIRTFYTLICSQIFRYLFIHYRENANKYYQRDRVKIFLKKKKIKSFTLKNISAESTVSLEMVYFYYVFLLSIYYLTSTGKNNIRRRHVETEYGNIKLLLFLSELISIVSMLM